MTPSESANLPRFAGQRGFFESWFVDVHDRAQHTGLSLRFLISSPKGPSDAPSGELWAAAYGQAGRHFALVERVPFSGVHLAKERFSIAVAGATLDHYGTRGAIEQRGASLRWDLSWAEDELLEHLPYAQLYRRRYPKTKLLAPHFAMVASGRFWVNGVEHAVLEDRGLQAHQWGEAQPRRWMWCHVPGFKEDHDARLESLTADIAMGPLRLPPLTVHVLRYKGRVLRLNRAQDVLRLNESRTDAKLHLEDSYALGRWTIGGGAPDLRFHGEVWAEPEHFLGLSTDDPDGTRRYLSRTKGASARIEILGPDQHGGWRVTDTLHAEGWAAMELGGLSPDARVAR